MEDKVFGERREEQVAFIALLQEQRDIANEKHASVWRNLQFTTASVSALLGVSALLLMSNGPISNEPISKYFILIPFLALILSVFGIITLNLESKLYLRAEYATSVIRHKVTQKTNLKKTELLDSGVDDKLWNDFSCWQTYVKKRSFTLNPKRIRGLMYWLYIFLIVTSIVFLYSVYVQYSGSVLICG